MSTDLVSFNDFMSLPIFYYRIIGMNPYDSTNNQQAGASRLLYFNYILQMLFCAFTLMMEATFVTLNIKDPTKIVEVSMVISYFGYLAVGQLKTLSVRSQIAKLNTLVREMESIFPASNLDEQLKYKAKHYLRHCQFLQRAFSSLYLFLVLIYSISSLLGYCIQRFLLHNPDAEQKMPYYKTTPWNWHNWSFLPTYSMEVWAAISCTCGHIAADLFIYAITMQLVMHFDYLSKSLRGFKSHNNCVKDLKVLQHFIAYQNKLLRLSEVMNSVFGVPQLLNFLTSSVMVCFVGFQMTLGLSADHLIKLALFLISAVAEFYLICYFSDLLIVASKTVASAVYEMNWFQLDQRIKKMLVTIALRAQKPMCVKATIFLHISMETMTMFLKMSYKLFCLIRTMYQ